MNDTHTPPSALARQKLSLKLVSHFQIKIDGDRYVIYILHIIGLCPFCAREMCYAFTSLSLHFFQV